MSGGVSKREIDKLLIEYGASHRNPVNKIIHWICVPVIFVCTVGIISSIPFPLAQGTWAHVLSALALVFYVRLSPRLAVGMFGFIFFSFWLLAQVKAAGYDTLKVSIVSFVVAWIGQFIGHSSLFEGKKPSFFKDLFFLLVGPAWLMHFVYKKLGIAY